MGSSLGWSDLFFFRTFATASYAPASNWKPTFAVFGDMGNENAQSLPRLQRETQQGM